MKRTLLLGFIAFTLAFVSCRKDNIISSNGIKLAFSTDTVFLDTVFRDINSSTYTLKVFNPKNETVNIDQIKLTSGNAGVYRLNIDGNPGNIASNVKILPKDSIYIFIELTAKLNLCTDMVCSDSIIFSNNGVEQNVKLVAQALDAYFHFPTNFVVIGTPPNTITLPYSFLAEEGQDITLPNDKPHVIYGYALVDTASTLRIPPGTDLHFHSGGGIWVLEGGSLKVAENANPAFEDSVTFTSDRLEPFYEDAAGQWGGIRGGIWLGIGSVDNVINNAVIKNANTGLYVDSNDIQNLTLTNTYILNHSRVGLYGAFANMEAENVVVANTGLFSLYCFGGNYEFRHCTFANYWNQSTRNDPAVALTNFFEFQDQSGSIVRIVREINQAYFGNCIIDGSNRQELGIIEDNSKPLNYLFNSAMLKLDSDVNERGFDVSDPAHFIQGTILINSDPGFVNRNNNRFALDSTSQAVDQGNIPDGTMVDTDIKGNNRNVGGLPDLGAYEKQD